MRLVSPSEDLPSYVELEFTAAAPYLSFVYDSEPDARAIAELLIEQDVGDGAPSCGHLAVNEDGATVGMLAYLDAEELAQRRGAAAISLVRSGRIARDGEVRERMLAAGTTLCSVGERDLYLSRIAVAAHVRRQGAAAWMLEQVARVAASRGKDRVVLEVSSLHVAARRLYENQGYDELGERVAVGEPGRTLTYHHMARRVDGSGGSKPRR